MGYDFGHLRVGTLKITLKSILTNWIRIIMTSMSLYPIVYSTNKYFSTFTKKIWDIHFNNMFIYRHMSLIIIIEYINKLEIPFFEHIRFSGYVI